MVSSTPPDLVELPGPVGLDKRFCLDFPITLILDKPFKQWSGGDLKVYDVTKHLRLQCEGKVSWSYKRLLRDADHKLLFVSRTKYTSWTWKTVVDDAEGHAAMHMSRQRGQWKTKLQATFHDVFTKQERTLHLESANVTEDATITLDGQNVGFVSKDVSLGLNRRLHVAKNMDHALLVQLVVYYDCIMAHDD